MTGILPAHKIHRIPKKLVKVGEPIKYPIYDKNGTLLLKEGSVVHSENQLQQLFERGLYLETEAMHALLRLKMDLTDGDTIPVEQEKTYVRVDLNPNVIEIGESIFISPLSDTTGKERYAVKYLGALNKKTLICTQPEVDNKLVAIKENTTYKVQIFTGKDIYVFNTLVEVVTFKPLPIVYFKYPNFAETQTLRKNQRVNMNAITSSTNKTTGVKFAARMIDISLGGTMLEAQSEVGKMGDEIECAFKVPIDGNDEIVTIAGEIRSLNEVTIDDKTTYKVGLKFVHLPQDAKLRLQNYIYQQITGIKLDEL